MIPDTNLGLFIQIPSVHVYTHANMHTYRHTHTLHTTMKKKRITSSLLSEGDKKLGDDFMYKVYAV